MGSISTWGNELLFINFYFCALVTTKSAALSCAIQHTMPGKSSGQWGTDSLDTGFFLPIYIAVYTRYNVKKNSDGRHSAVAEYGTTIMALIPFRGVNYFLFFVKFRQRTHNVSNVSKIGRKVPSFLRSGVVAKRSVKFRHSTRNVSRFWRKVRNGVS